MDGSATLQLLLHGNQLKRTVRTGWVQRGVPNPENVAAHSFGVAFAVLTLAAQLTEPIDLERALGMAVLHDLPEGLTTDIPTPAWRFLPANIKTTVEREAMNEILAGMPAIAPTLLSYWEELHANQTIEAKLVHDADLLDLLVQAYQYEQQTGNQHLAEFWDDVGAFHFLASQAVFDALIQKRTSAVKAFSEFK